MIQRPGNVVRVVSGGVLALAIVTGAEAVGTQAPAAPAAGTPRVADERDEGITPPADYVIGPDDSLSVRYWKDDDMSADVVVRPDGMISLPLLNDVRASGLTPEQLRARITEAASKFVEGPNVQIIVREINSRLVYITGNVGMSKHYPLAGPVTVLQLIAMAGGLNDYANTKNIRIIRIENGQPRSYQFNYNQVREGKNLHQNIELKPGDTVVVP